MFLPTAHFTRRRIIERRPSKTKTKSQAKSIGTVRIWNGRPTVRVRTKELTDVSGKIQATC